jgi:hypothetical protein
VNSTSAYQWAEQVDFRWTLTDATGTELGRWRFYGNQPKIDLPAGTYRLTVDNDTYGKHKTVAHPQRRTAQAEPGARCAVARRRARAPGRGAG